MNLVRTCAAICTILLLAPGLAQARIRPTFQDATVAERAELIVIGHLDRDSIKYVPHDTSPDSGRSWEHHATLVITDILKGASKEKRIPIVIHYGLDIAIGRLWPKHAEPGKPAAPDADAPVAIYDTGNSSISFEPVLKNC